MSDGTVVAALLNKGPQTANITVPLSLFGAQWAQRPPGSGAGVEVRDPWPVGTQGPPSGHGELVQCGREKSRGGRL
jgi:hypothetical protein